MNKVVVTIKSEEAGRGAARQGDSRPLTPAETRGRSYAAISSEVF